MNDRPLIDLSMLDFDKSGVLFWAVSRGPMRQGCPAGAVKPNGYWSVKIGGRNYYVHRVVFLKHYGRWPAAQIDHIDGNRGNNRIENLREATPAQNQQNQPKNRLGNKTTGTLGTSYEKSRGLFSAQITASGKKMFLGRYETIEKAHAAYVAAKRRFHEFGRL